MNGIILRHSPGSFREYAEKGGVEALKKAFSLGPRRVMEEVSSSNLRGRGGAGFPTGRKWSFIPESADEKFFVVNADEGEPGTFKDREIIRKNPYLLIEGIIISAYAVGAKKAFIYIRGEFAAEAQILEKAIGEFEKNGLLGGRTRDSSFSLEIIVHRGAGAYICGEETALLESIEGKRGLPRLKPPFPAVKGLFGKPTVINNVETVAAVPAIVMKGGKWYASLGTEKSGGTKLFSISGPVRKPGVYECELGIPFRKLLEDFAGGMDGDELKAVIPGGSSTPVLTAREAMAVRMDYESLQEAGSMLGSGAVIVIGKKQCMVSLLLTLAEFYHHESCGQCTPCREGGGWMVKILKRLESGKAYPGDIDLLSDLAASLKGKTFCPLGDALAMPVESFTKKFREEFEEHARGKLCAGGVYK